MVPSHPRARPFHVERAEVEALTVRLGRLVVIQHDERPRNLVEFDHLLSRIREVDH